jgi:hypothetical protein
VKLRICPYPCCLCLVSGIGAISPIRSIYGSEKQAAVRRLLKPEDSLQL